MAIQRVSGNILQDNLQRGANLSIQGNLAYFDVTNNRVGILTGTPQDEFNVIGVANASNVRITSATANGVFYAGASQLALTNSGFTYDGTTVDVSGNVDAGNVNVVSRVYSSTGYFTGNVDVLGNLNATVGVVYANSGIFYGNTITGINAAFAGVPGFTPLGSNVIMQFAGNVNSYAQLNFQNINAGNLSSTDYIATANNGDDNTYFLNMGIAGNNHVDPEFFGDTSSANDAYLYVVGVGNNLGNTGPGNLILGSTDGRIKMFVGNTAQANVIQELTTAGSNITGVLNVTGNITGGNIISSGAVIGNVQITGNITVNNATVLGNTTSNNISIGNVLTVGGNITGGNLISNAGIFGTTANITGNTSVGNLIITGTTANRVLYTDSNKNVATTNNLTFNGTALVLTGTANVSSDVFVGNLYSAALINAVGNITGNNVIANGNVSGNYVNVTKDIYAGGNAIIDGNLTINGDLVYENVTTLAVEDPIISMGRGANNTPLVSNDGKDRGEQLWYYNGAEKSAFMGYDNSAGNLIAAVDVSIANEIVTVNQFGTWQVGNIYAQSALITGNVSFGNISTSGQLSATGNITGGNLVSNASISAATTINATGNITGGNLVSNASISAATTVSATGNVTGGNLVSNASISAATTVNATGNITGGNLVSNASISAATTVSATGNVTGGNLVSNARITGTTLSVSGDALVAGNLTVQGNITYINIDDLRVEDPIIQLGGGANGNALITNDGKDRGTLLTYYTTAQGNAFVGWDNSSGNMIIASNVTLNNEIVTINQFGTFQAGNIYGESATIVGNVSFGNISTTGQISATGNVTGGNLVSNASISAATTINATGNITGGNLVSNASISAATTISATGNITGGNIVSNALVTGANAQVTSLTTNRIVYVGANDYLVDTANLTFDGANLVLIGSANIDNIRIDGTTITSNANLSITATSGNILVTPGPTGVTQIGSTTALTMPVGNTAQRPASPDQGAVRFNSTTLVLEVWDGTQWDVVGQDLAILTSQVINGDGSQVAFTLNEDTTSGGILVSINGVSQIPDVSYGVVGNVITFSEAPQVSDAVEVRFLTQIQTVTEITNTTGNSIVGVQANASQVNITGNLLPTANVTYNLGSPTLRWKDGYFSGNSITLGNIILKNTSGNTLSFFGPDGTTPGTLSSNNVDTTQISNGTSNVQTLSSGSVTISAGGTANVLIVTSTNANVGGNINVSSNANVSGNINLSGNIVDSGGQLGISTTSNGNITLAPNGTGVVVITSDLRNGQANGVGNIGSSSTYFNTMFAKATSAQYADLAEQFECDQVHDAGTVMVFAGDNEITQSTQYADQRLAGIISTDPAYLMNAEQANSVPIAMAGRVPCWVVGPVNKGDVLTTSSTAGHAEKLKNTDWLPGVIVGKALESAPAGSHKIMVVVGAW